MSFTVNIKDEVISYDFKNREEFSSFLKGYIVACGIKNDSSHFSFKIKINKYRDIFISQFKNWLFNYQIEDNFILVSINFDAILEENQFFIMGLFVGGGYISNPNSTSYHLQLKIKFNKMLNDIQTLLKSNNFSFHIFQNRILYLKSSSQISDFLKFIFAIEGLMYFEDIRTKRDFHSNLVRASNLEFYNQKKITNSTIKYLEYVQLIKKKKLTTLFTNEQLQFINLKTKYPELSLEELSKLLLENFNINKSKSTLNYWIKKIKKIAQS